MYVCLLFLKGIIDESEKFIRLGMDEDFSIPNIHIYYNDDLNDA